MYYATVLHATCVHVAPCFTHQFWGHEWSKHGTCSGLDEHTYFETALDLAQKHRNTCTKGNTCLICFEKDLKTLTDCASSMVEEK